jgi:hypothetical protein
MHLLVIILAHDELTRLPALVAGSRVVFVVWDKITVL